MKTVLNKHSVSLTITIIAIIGVASLKNIGIMWDAEMHAAFTFLNYRMLTKGEPLPFDLAFYGTFFDATTYIPYRLFEALFGEFVPPAGVDPRWLLVRIVSYGHRVILDSSFYAYKNYCVFIFSLSAYLAAAALLGVLAGKRYAWLACLSLTALPRFWGHSLFNFKDSPFAASFTVCTLLGALFIADFLKYQPNLKPSTRYGKAIAFGLAIGVCTSIRAGGIVLLPFAFLTWSLLLALSLKLPSLRSLRSGAMGFLTVVVTWAIVVYAFHPSAWFGPITWLKTTLIYLAKHGFAGFNLFEGDYVSTQALRWYYMPLWLGLTTPVFILLLFVVGIIAGSINFFSFDQKQKAAWIMLVLQAFFLLFYAIYHKSTIDAGVRQFLFILPAMGVFAAYGFVYVYKLLRIGSLKFVWSALSLYFVAMIWTDMYKLNPYQYIYFGRLADTFYSSPEDSTHLSRQFETEYLGLSLREAAEWLNTNGDRKIPVYMNGPFHSLAVFLDPRFKLTHLAHIDSKLVKPPFYYASLPRGRWDNLYADCPFNYRIKRKIRNLEFPLSIVRSCP